MLVKFSVVDENESTSSALHGNFSVRAHVWKLLYGLCRLSHSPVPCMRVRGFSQYQELKVLGTYIYSRLKRIHDLIHWKWNSSLIEWFYQMIRLQLLLFFDVVMNILFR